MATQVGPAPNGSGQNNKDQDGIPVLTSISPSIFVPTTRDFTQPPPPLSDDPITRLEATIEALEWHASRVEDNMIAMFVREAQRVRAVGQVERVQYDANNRPIRHPRRDADMDLLLEERIIRDEVEAQALWKKEKRQREDDRLRRDSRDAKYHFPPHARPQQQSSSMQKRSPEPREPEYADLATIRRERMFRADVDEFRQSPRSAALTHVLNLVKWGWDDQLDGHRGAVNKEKQEWRSNLHLKMKETPFQHASNGPPQSAPQQPSRPSTADNAQIHNDPMHLD